MSNAASHPAAAVRALVPSRRPRPIIRRAEPADLAWDPVAIEQFTVVDGENVRSGESYAIVRPGLERWPLGHVSDHYRVTPHRATAAAIASFCAESVTPAGAIIVGHGYHVAHSYEVRHMQAAEVAGVPLVCRLVVASSHTGGEAVRASMVVYVGRDAVGSIVRSRALHVASQPERWQADVDGMIEKAILVQDALADLLRAAAARELTDADRSFFKARKMVVKKSARTAFDAVRSWTRGNTRQMTYGVWERRLDDEAVRALVVLLGRDVHGVAIDDAMGWARRDAAGNVVGGVFSRAR